MKNYVAYPLEGHLMELSGSPSSKVSKIVDILGIYSKDFNPNNVSKHIRSEGDPEFTIVDGDKEGEHGVLIHRNQLLLLPYTLGGFVSIMFSLGLEVYWEETTWQKYLYINRKY